MAFAETSATINGGDIIHGANLAIVGGGEFCKRVIAFFLNETPEHQKPKIIGVADRNPEADGIRFAREGGIYTTAEYSDLFKLPDLQVILEITRDADLPVLIRKFKPPHVHLIDHFEFRYIWQKLRIDHVRGAFLRAYQSKRDDPDAVEDLVGGLFEQLKEVIGRANRRSREIETELVEYQRILTQIIEGSTMPTFVINHKHVVTHWNKALEHLSGWPADRVVGTTLQWAPFWDEERPSMADVVLDQLGDEEIRKFYGGKWKKSALIEGAYEAEFFFPNLGSEGKWCWFTAAPIKDPKGNVIGAIETLWDKTEDKKAEEERERHTRLLTETARELSKSKDTILQIIQGSTIPTFVIDETHRITHWNRALERLTGHTANELIGTDGQWRPFYSNARPTMADVILDQIGESEIRKLYGTWRKSTLIEDAYEAEGYFPKLGPNGRWAWFTAAPIKDPEGNIIGAIETLWDKTEDKKAEEERERHTYELSTLCTVYSALNVSSDIDSGIRNVLAEIKSFLSADSICVYLITDGGKYARKYGYGGSSGPLEMPCREHIGPDEAFLVNRVLDTNEFAIADVPTPVGDSTRRPSAPSASLAYVPIISRDKKIFGFIRVWSNQPKRFSHDQKNVLELIGNRIGVAIENAILQDQYIKSEEKYRTLFNNDPHPIFILDSQTFRIQDINRRTQDSYGYTRDELIGVPFLQLGDAKDEELSNGLRNLAEDRSMLFTKKRHYRKDGRPFFVDVNISHAKYGESDVIIAATTDITESVEKETQLIQASKMTTVGQMAAGMAHEINQPLNVIQICADFLQKCLNKGIPVGEEELKSMANDISENVQRATGIISHMRNFARQSDVVKTKVDINRPIRDVFKVLGHQLKVHQIELKLDLAPDIPPILAEHNRLEQVFINMVTNAVDAIDEKGEKLGDSKWDRILEIRSFLENGNVVVKVTDSGIGMTDEIKQKIFEPFFTTKKVGKGTGLGVAISYGIIKEYDGTITVESEFGKGTTFKISIPAYRNG